MSVARNRYKYCNDKKVGLLTGKTIITIGVVVCCKGLHQWDDDALRKSLYVKAVNLYIIVST